MLPFLIAGGAALASGVINYFGEKQKNDQIASEMERRRRELENAKYTSQEIFEGKANIARTHRAATDSNLNKFAFTSRGLQADTAKGALIGQAQAGMVSDINNYVNATTQFNKNISREQALTGAVPTTSPLLAGASGAIAGFQTGLAAERYIGAMQPNVVPDFNLRADGSVLPEDQNELLAFGETLLEDEPDPFANATSVEDFVDIGMKNAEPYNSYVSNEGNVISNAGNANLARPEQLLSLYDTPFVNAQKTITGQGTIGNVRHKDFAVGDPLAYRLQTTEPTGMKNVVMEAGALGSENLNKEPKILGPTFEEIGDWFRELFPEDIRF